MASTSKRNQEGSLYSCPPKTEELNNTNTEQNDPVVLQSYHFWILKAATCL